MINNIQFASLAPALIMSYNYCYILFQNDFGFFPPENLRKYTAINAVYVSYVHIENCWCSFLELYFFFLLVFMLSMIKTTLVRYQPTGAMCGRQEDRNNVWLVRMETARRVRNVLLVVDRT